MSDCERRPIVVRKDATQESLLQKHGESLPRIMTETETMCHDNYTGTIIPARALCDLIVPRAISPRGEKERLHIRDIRCRHPRPTYQWKQREIVKPGASE